MKLEDQLDEALSDLGAAPPPLPPTSAELERELASLRPTTTRRPRKQLALTIVTGSIYLAVLLWMFSLRRDLGELPRMWLVAYLTGWTAGFAGILTLALVPRRGEMMPRWRPAAFFAVAAGIAFVLGGLLLARHVPGTSITYEPTLNNVIEYSRACLLFGVLTSALPILLGVIALRGAVPVRSAWVAAALGAAGGCLGGLFLHLHCPITEKFHLGIVHGGIVVVSAAVAALVGSRLLRP